MILESVSWYVITCGGYYQGYTFDDQLAQEYLSCPNANHLILNKYVLNEDDFCLTILDTLGVRNGSDEKYKIKRWYNDTLDCYIYGSDDYINNVLFMTAITQKSIKRLLHCVDKLLNLSEYCLDGMFQNFLTYLNNYQIPPIIDDRVSYHMDAINNPVVDWLYMLALVGYIYVDREIPLPALRVNDIADIPHYQYTPYPAH